MCLHLGTDVSDSLGDSEARAAKQWVHGSTSLKVSPGLLRRLGELQILGERCCLSTSSASFLSFLVGNDMEFFSEFSFSLVKGESSQERS